MRHTTGPIAILDAPVPPGFGRKALGFTIGLTAALVLNLLVGPGSSLWRSSAIARPSDPASSAQTVPTVAASDLEAKPSPVAAAHKASRSTKRQPPKHRQASRR
jgi:hypothetical protein